jgi:hypothetical protein
MNREDIIKVLLTYLSADAGCFYCGVELTQEAMKMWPDFDWAALDLTEADFAGDHTYERVSEMLARALR